MKIVVTGGAGFVGSHYVRTLLAGGHPACEHAGVVVLDELTYPGNLTRLAPVADDPRRTMVESVPDRAGHGRRHALSRTKIAEMLDHSPIGLDEGLLATVEWYRDKPGMVAAAQGSGGAPVVKAGPPEPPRHAGSDV